MNRPYTVCHIFSALDGAIVGNYMYAPETTAAREQYGKLRATFDSNAILYGTTTMLDFCDGYVSDLPMSKPIERKDFIAPHTENRYVIAIDRHGKLAYSQSYLEGTDCVSISLKCLPKRCLTNILRIFVNSEFHISLQDTRNLNVKLQWSN